MKFLYKKYINIFAFLFVFIVLFTLSLDIFSVGIAEAIDMNKFDNTYVMDDLMSSSVNDERFDLAKYPVDKDGELQVISFEEYGYCYDSNGNENYGLYLYVYNPAQLDISLSSKSNKVEIAKTYDVEGEPTSYGKYNLLFLSASEGEYAKLFYKFKVVDTEKTILNRVIGYSSNFGNRRYDISGAEFIAYGQNTAIEYTVGSTYSFKGYASGYGADATADSTLICSVKEFETLSIDLFHTFFRPEGFQKESTFKYTRAQLDSVYFSFPQNLLSKYGGIYSIEASYYAYRTSPVVVTSSKEVYDGLKNYVGKTLTSNHGIHDWGLAQKYNVDCPYILYDVYTPSASFLASLGLFTYQYNHAFSALDENSISTSLPYLLYTGNYSSSSVAPLAKDFTLPAEALKDYIYSYDKSFDSGKLDIKNGLSNDLFQGTMPGNIQVGYNSVKIFADDTYDLMNIVRRYTMYDWWDFFGLFAQYDDLSYNNIPAIVTIDTNDLAMAPSEFCKKYFVDENDYNSIKDECTKGLINSKTVYLFRFAQSNCCTRPLTISGDTFLNSDNAYVSEQSVYLDMDISSITCMKDGEFYTIAVVTNPIDAIADVQKPPEQFDVFGWWKNFWKDKSDIIKTVLMVIAIVILLILVFFIVSTIHKQISNSNMKRNISKMAKTQKFERKKIIINKNHRRKQ